MADAQRLGSSSTSPSAVSADDGSLHHAERESMAIDAMSRPSGSASLDHDIDRAVAGLENLPAAGNPAAGGESMIRRLPAEAREIVEPPAATLALGVWLRNEELRNRVYDAERASGYAPPALAVLLNTAPVEELEMVEVTYDLGTFHRSVDAVLAAVPAEWRLREMVYKYHRYGNHNTQKHRFLLLAPQRDLDALYARDSMPAKAWSSFCSEGRTVFVWPNDRFVHALKSVLSEGLIPQDHPAGCCPPALLGELGNRTPAEGGICPCKTCLHIDTIPMCTWCTRLAVYSHCVRCLRKETPRLTPLAVRQCPDCKLRLVLGKCPECIMETAFPASGVFHHGTHHNRWVYLDRKAKYFAFPPEEPETSVWDPELTPARVGGVTPGKDVLRDEVLKLVKATDGLTWQYICVLHPGVWTSPVVIGGLKPLSLIPSRNSAERTENLRLRALHPVEWAFPSSAEELAQRANSRHDVLSELRQELGEYFHPALRQKAKQKARHDAEKRARKVLERRGHIPKQLLRDARRIAPSMGMEIQKSSWGAWVGVPTPTASAQYVPYGDPLPQAECVAANQPRKPSVRTGGAGPSRNPKRDDSSDEHAGKQRKRRH